MVPFVPALTIIEIFFLLIPFGVIFIATLIYLTISLLNTNLNKRKALFVFLLLPTFISSQLLSSFTVDKIQRLRSEKIIEEVEEHKVKTGELPDSLYTRFGIEYNRMNDKVSFQITYTRGFMVREKYHSQYKQWSSYGWND